MIDIGGSIELVDERGVVLARPLDELQPVVEVSADAIDAASAALELAASAREIAEMMEIGAGVIMVQAARQLDLAHDRNDVDQAIRAVRLYIDSRSIWLRFSSADPPAEAPRPLVTIDDLVAVWREIRASWADYRLADKAGKVAAAIDALERMMRARQRWYEIAPFKADRRRRKGPKTVRTEPIAQRTEPGRNGKPVSSGPCASCANPGHSSQQAGEPEQ